MHILLSVLQIFVAVGWMVAAYYWNPLNTKLSVSCGLLSILWFGLAIAGFMIHES
jgi:hypothetical protein